MDVDRWVLDVAPWLSNLAQGVAVPFGPATVTYVLGLLPSLALSAIVLWDATKRDVRRRFTWAGGVLVATVAPVFGAYVVGLLYFLVTRDRGPRVGSTGLLIGLWGIVKGVLLVPFALSAYDSFLAVVGLVPVALLLLVWFAFGGR